MRCQPRAHMLLDRADQRRVAVVSRLEDDECLHRLGTHGIGNAHRRRHRHGGMTEQAILDLGRTDPVARRGDYVVGAAQIPEIPVLVLATGVAGEQPVAGELLRRRARITPVAEEHDRIGPPDRDVPGFARGKRPPAIIDDRDLVSRDRATHRSRPHRHDIGAIADDEIAFGLAVELVDRHAECVAAPVEQLGAERLTAAADRAQAHAVIGRRTCLTHELERGRRQEDVAHRVARHQAEGGVRVEFAEAMRQHRHAVVPGGQKDIEQSADPRPVGRRPEQVARLRKERLRKLDARQVTQQHAMGMQRALGRARRARGKDDHRRIIRRRDDGRESIRRPLERRREIPRAGLAVAAHHQHDLEIGQTIADRQHLRQIGGIGHQRARRRILQPVFERFFAEQNEQRNGDHPGLVGGDVRHRRLRRLLEQDGDAIAALAAEAGERVGEPIRLPPDLLEAVPADRPILVLEDERGRVWPRGGMAVARIDRDVVGGRNLPAKLGARLVVSFGRRQHFFGLFPWRHHSQRRHNSGRYLGHELRALVLDIADSRHVRQPAMSSTRILV